ncbi:MAG: hypothetical protein JHD35_26695 [Sphingopyxis sp.]|uniref:hypothetical protein n=1 Tax=Bosea sp. (in: a-proteobacteria) TaxID=1871050 RepID=UPI0011F87D3F|nr:hypothetical protein [Bosea sp. (in: a-proteobacteria)]MBJ7442587.1 hypothetical protein [Sphingopyxis sp.]TAJ28132.1 MAG: hypothetical protein EPO59_19530 [Bosea sp. (in: a-proteobacteria)]
MHIIRTWPELADWLENPVHRDIAALLRLRRDQLIDCGDQTEIGTFVIVERGDALADMESALDFPITMAGSPTWEWVMRHGAIFEAPVILSDDGFGHVLIVPDADGIDPDLLTLCRAHT